jgi:hypothetical protein
MIRIAILATLLTSPLASAPLVAIDLRVSRIDLDVTLDPIAGTLQETVALVVAGKGAAHLVFAIDEGLSVKTSRANEGTVDHRQAGSELIVDLDPPLDTARTLTFTIGGRPRRGTETEIDPKRAVLAPSSAWYPQLRHTWATTAVTVRLPAGWAAMAPGTAAKQPAPGVFRFTTERPVRSIAVAAAPGLRIVEGSIVRVPFRLATTASNAPVKADAQRLGPAMAWLSGALAPYPFDAFGLVTLPGYSGRVQASGLMIVGTSVPLSTDADGADLLAGQWFGEALGGDGAWIEAFAAWEACVFARDRSLPVPGEIARLRAGYFGLLSGDVALGSAPATAPVEVLRGKGSAAPDMVRLIAGDRAVFNAVRELFAAPPGPALSLGDVKAAIEKQANRPLDRAFGDWFERAGAPEFESNLRSFPAAGGGFRADIAVTQKRGAYALPVEIVVYGAGQEHRETIEVAEPATRVFYVLPFAPTRIEIDPLNRIFRWE